jgi:hypothetical protein
LKVSTLISADLSVASLNTAALTFVVMAASSMYSPVPYVLAVDAQPMNEASPSIRRKVEKRLRCAMVNSPGKTLIVAPRPRSRRSALCVQPCQLAALSVVNVMRSVFCR